MQIFPRIFPRRRCKSCWLRGTGFDRCRTRFRISGASIVSSGCRDYRLPRFRLETRCGAFPNSVSRKFRTASKAETLPGHLRGHLHAEALVDAWCRNTSMVRIAISATACRLRKPQHHHRRYPVRFASPSGGNGGVGDAAATMKPDHFVRSINAAHSFRERNSQLWL